MPQSDCENTAEAAECMVTEIVKMTINEMGQRLCHMVKRPDFDGYGFNLHSEKGKPGQFIGKVDDNSPAEQAGIKQGDRIIEVNGVDIGNESHKQVVQRIKAISNEVRLLVIDPEVEKAQKAANGKTTTSTASTATVQSSTAKSVAGDEAPPPLPDVAAIKNNNNNNSIHSTSERNSISSNNNVTVVDGELFIDTKSNGRQSSNGHYPSAQTTIQTVLSPVAGDGMKNGNGNANAITPPASPMAETPAPKAATEPLPMPPQIPLPPPPSKVTASESAQTPGLNLKMTVAEMRAKLLAKKKYDPKNDSVDLRKKFDIIQKL